MGRFKASMVLITFAASAVVWMLRLLPPFGLVSIQIAAFSPYLLLFGALLALALSALVLRPWARALAGLQTWAIVWLFLAAANPTQCFGGSESVADVRIYSQNVLWTEGSADGVAAEISKADPDLVFLQEADHEFVGRVLAELDSSSLSHVIESRSQATLGLAVLSRWPLDDVIDTAEPNAPSNPLLLATLVRPDGALRVANVHISSPTDVSHLPRMKLEYEMLDRLYPDVDVIAGDFNSTGAHRQFRQLLGDEYIDANAAASCAPTPTATATWSPFRSGPGLLALDHVLLRKGSASVLETKVMGYHKSDHRGLLVSLTVDPR